MPTPTYKALATVTLGSSAATVTFGSIPATYRDLVMILNCKILTGTPFPRARVNGDSGSNYFRLSVVGNGSTATSTTSTSTVLALSGDASASTDFNYNTITNFMDYSATDKHKTVVSRGNNSAVATAISANRWTNTAAITSIEVSLTSSSFDVGSTFNLYGIVA